MTQHQQPNNPAVEPEVMTDERTPVPDTLPIPTKPLILAAPSMALDPRQASTDGVAMMRERVEAQTQYLRLAVALTSPSQWVNMGGSIYPMGGAADTIIRRALGGAWRDVRWDVHGHGDDMTAEAVGELWFGGELYDTFLGTREMGGYIHKRSDLIKGAIENMKSRAVQDILGLRGRTPSELGELGLDLSKTSAREAGFKDNAAPRGGDSGPVVRFGRDKGTPLVEVEDLTWYRNALLSSIADPSKDRYRSKNERDLADVDAELDRRAKAAVPGGDLWPQAMHALDCADSVQECRELFKHWMPRLSKKEAQQFQAECQRVAKEMEERDDPHAYGPPAWDEVGA